MCSESVCVCVSWSQMQQSTAAVNTLASDDKDRRTTMVSTFSSEFYFSHAARTVSFVRFGTFFTARAMLAWY